jgi:hypothetical protein
VGRQKTVILYRERLKRMVDCGETRSYRPRQARAGEEPMSFTRGSFGGMYSAGMSAARVIILAALLLAGACLPSAGLAQGCVSGREARQLIQQGQVVPLPEALRRAGVARNQIAGNPRLCAGGGGFVYQVRVVQDGQVTSVTIPAN